MMPKFSILKTPWYNILSNPNYCDDFQYIGPHVQEREKLIIDQDSDQANSFEQSDVVLLLLNLAYIPDEIAKQFDFSPGFSERFVSKMKKYKQDFEARTGSKWSRIDSFMKKAYIRYIRSRQKVANLKFDQNATKEGKMSMI